MIISIPLSELACSLSGVSREHRGRLVAGIFSADPRKTQGEKEPSLSILYCPKEELSTIPEIDSGGDCPVSDLLIADAGWSTTEGYDFNVHLHKIRVPLMRLIEIREDDNLLAGHVEPAPGRVASSISRCRSESPTIEETRGQPSGVPMLVDRGRYCWLTGTVVRARSLSVDDFDELECSVHLCI